MSQSKFLDRWARKKSGIPDEPTKDESKAVDSGSASSPASPTEAQALTAPAPEAPPPPTMDDVDKIDSKATDFSAFMRADVDPTVQQAAMKKMFSDPHFNVMDGLDIYIDDYSKPDPIPLEMLKRMTQSDLLGIFKTTDELYPEFKDAKKEERVDQSLQEQPITEEPAALSEEPEVNSTQLVELKPNNADQQMDIESSDSDKKPLQIQQTGEMPIKPTSNE